MSDTPDEIHDHGTVIARLENKYNSYEPAKTVLIHGLGIGVVLQAALLAGSVENVDVVEIQPEVIELVGPHYEKMAANAGKQLTIHCDDAYTKKWPAGQCWDVVWHDIWRDICTDNLEGIGKLHRRFGKRCKWQGSWQREFLQYQRKREKASGWY